MKFSIDVSKDELKYKVSKKLRIPLEDFLSFEIEKRSLDARKKNNILYVYNFSVELRNENEIIDKKIPNVQEFTPKESRVDYSKYLFDKTKKVAVIGFGPAGMFAALSLSKAGIECTVFERGEEVDKRIKTVSEFSSKGVLNTESNIQFGEGGAGTFSDGKLTNRKKDIRGKWLFRELVNAGAPEEILYVHNPHIGTDKLINVVKNIRQEILDLGSTIHFNSKVENVIPFNKGYELIVNGDKQYYDYVILAIGHSSRDTIKMLFDNQFDIVQKPFAVGFRIEHKQTLINKSQYGESYNHKNLGSAEYKLTHQTESGKGVYTFCMCPGGTVMPSSSEENTVVVNGMSEYARDKVNANSALLVTVDGKDFGSDHPLAGIEYQRKIERKAFELGGNNYSAPIQKVVDFVENRSSTKLGNVLPSYSIGYKLSNLREVYSEEINNAFIEALSKMGNKIKGFNDSNALLTGVESRSSSPVRINRDKDSLEAINNDNFYPTGEGAGYAGGIVSAAIDGIRVSELIIDKLTIKIS